MQIVYCYKLAKSKSVFIMVTNVTHMNFGANAGKHTYKKNCNFKEIKKLKKLTQVYNLTEY